MPFWSFGCFFRKASYCEGIILPFDREIIIQKSLGEMPSRDKQVPGPMILGGGKPDREERGCQAPWELPGRLCHWPVVSMWRIFTVHSFQLIIKTWCFKTATWIIITHWTNLPSLHLKNAGWVHPARRGKERS